MSTSLNFQHKTSFFHPPPEIRRLIYSHLITSSRFHIRLYNSRPCLSPCVTLDDDRNDLDGSERQSKDDEWGGDTRRDEVWARRLRSTWGRHWKCEEIVAEGKGKEKDEDGWEGAEKLPINLMVTCKQMYMDVVDVLVDIARFHVTDLETLGCLIGKRVSPEKDGEKWEYLASAMMNVRNLHVSLRLPQTVMRSLEQNSGVDAETSDGSNHCEIWRGLPKWIESLQYLRRLEICLDHDTFAPWELANERALFPRSSLERLPKIDIRLILPEIHHRYHDPEIRFTNSEEEGALPFSVQRRCRTRWQGLSKSLRYSKHWVTPSWIFPTFAEAEAGYRELLCEERVDVEAMEWYELDAWKRGIDLGFQMSDLEDQLESLGCTLGNV